MLTAPLLRLLSPPSRSFFLFGARGVGKSTWLKSNLPDAIFFDLLKSRVLLELAPAPYKLEAMIDAHKSASWIVLDEIQKAPHLLDEVHRLIEDRRWKFVLCGSSARKLRRGGTNLLGGRALTRVLEAFTAQELGKAFNIEAALQWGTLPIVHLDNENAADILDSYVHTYIQQEIKEEGVVRQLPPFLRFLKVAGMLNGQILNMVNIAREASVPRSSVDVYFSILTDTHLGHFLEAYRPNIKVREQAHPKFYWFDPGVARSAAGLLFDPLDRIWKGTALETLVYHELRVYNHTKNLNRSIYFYRTPSGLEIDFVIETRKRQSGSSAHVVCIETKLAIQWDRQWEKAMRHMAMTNDTVKVEKMIGVYTGTQRYRYGNLEVLPIGDFLVELHQGSIF